MECDLSPAVLTCEQARKLLGISRGLIYDAIKTGQVASIRIGKRILIPRQVIQKMLDTDTPKKIQT